MLKPLATVLLLVAAVSCQNSIDTSLPIVRTVSGLNTFDYFSYSMVLHQRTANPSSRAASLDTSRIIVSAPMHDIPGASTTNTGAVWECPINSGTCQPLNGDNVGADRRLYDTDGNGGNENKTNQFLGGSMASNGDFFIVCAHRYQTQVDGFFFPRGRCYYSDRDLSGFAAHTPCSRYGSTRNGGSGVCNAGTSAVVTSSGSTGEYGVGAPGSYLWRGAVTRLEQPGNVFDVTPNSGASADAFGLLGYAMTLGFFTTTARQDYAVSNPRFSQSAYLGRVSIVTNDQDLDITNQPLNGQQLGEYYGFSLLAANMAGDGRHELIVGAPMYRANGTAPDTGRIFIYTNTNGALSLLRTIVGREAFSRFGYAMANLGDINGDGFDDIAVSAPFGSAGGSVFIYHSSPINTIVPNPAQIITGEMVNMNLVSPNNALTGFGTTLASGVDVDGNTYNDLAVGSFVSQEVYLLRTRPLAEVAVTVSTTRSIVDLDLKDCPLRGVDYACFPLRTCVTYTGSGLSNTLDLTVTLVAERQNLLNNLEQRIFFDNGMAGQFPNMLSSVETATLGAQTCFDTTAYVQNGITDRFNGFNIETVITPPTFSPAATNGNVDPMDLSGFPVVSTSGLTAIQVETLKNCDGQTCIPDLGVTQTGLLFVGNSGQSPQQLTVGAVSQVNVQLTIGNQGDDAFQATLMIRFRTNQLTFQRVFNNTVSGSQLSLICSETTQDDDTVQTCNIGNPLTAGSSLTVNILFSPRPELVGDEGQITVEYMVGSVNEENAGTVGDNMETSQINVNAEADIFLDTPGIVFPESVSYADVPPEGEIVNVTQLGPSVSTTFVVRNNGPSTVPTTRLTIRWPLGGGDTLFNFIYPASISSESTATVVCSTANINPSNYDLPDEDETGGEGQVVTGGKRRRRRRSVPAEGRKVRRQANVDDNIDSTTTINRNFECAGAAPTLNCSIITCDILGLRGSSSAQVSINAYIDERFFSTSNDRFSFVPLASVAIVDADHITSQSTDTQATAVISVIPAGSIIPDTEVPPFPWYAVLFPIIAVIIIIAAIAVGLYFCGFFRRAKHEEIKQKREELQNLAENGVTATDKDGLDGTNL